MTEESQGGVGHGERQEPVEHPIRTALLLLLRDTGTLTANEASRQLGRSSGLCSFHLRRLAHSGAIEEIPHEGRARPWRLTEAGRRLTEAAGAPGPVPRPASPPRRPDPFASLNRGLEDESYQRWLDLRAQAPAAWRDRDEAFSSILYLSPEELEEVSAQIRALLRAYQHREWLPEHRPPGAAPVAIISRLFPVLPPTERGTPERHDS
ncbi:winged helix-turn-helix domain-containing protein [Streptomyces sp. NPDC057638]|uniref:winged helix-turn-helix domain-containing protein n=1 Tax=Streptomyces sp. NPDC057638 TaxID=3346190 RepID=UPI0036B42EB8